MNSKSNGQKNIFCQRFVWRSSGNPWKPQQSQSYHHLGVSEHGVYRIPRSYGILFMGKMMIQHDFLDVPRFCPKLSRQTSFVSWKIPWSLVASLHHRHAPRRFLEKHCAGRRCLVSVHTGVGKATITVATLWLTNSLLLKMAIEIVHLPIKFRWFSVVVNVYTWKPWILPDYTPCMTCLSVLKLWRLSLQGLKGMHGLHITGTSKLKKLSQFLNPRDDFEIVEKLAMKKKHCQQGHHCRHGKV